VWVVILLPASSSGAVFQRSGHLGAELGGEQQVVSCLQLPVSFRRGASGIARPQISAAARHLAKIEPESSEGIGQSHLNVWIILIKLSFPFLSSRDMGTFHGTHSNSH